MIWDSTAKQKLRQLWDAKLTANMIAEQLGCTRNAVVGMAHRMKLDKRPNPIKRMSEAEREARKREARARKVAAMKPKVVLPQNPPPTPKPIPAPVQLSSHPCQWLDGDPHLRQFCGEPCLMGRSYCPEHYARATIRKPVLG